MIENSVRHERPVVPDGPDHVERDVRVGSRWVRTMQYARHVALLALVQQRVILECAEVTIPLGTLGLGLREGQRALILQTAPGRQTHRRVHRDGATLACVDGAVEVFVDVHLVNCKDEMLL